MLSFVFRNSTVEPFFSNPDYCFSGYEDISSIPEKADSFIWFYTVPIKPDPKIIADEINDYISRIVLVSRNIARNRFLYAFSLVQLHRVEIVTGDHKLQTAVENYNNMLYSLAEENKNIRVINFQTFVSRYSSGQLMDWKYYYLSGIPINPKLSTDFQQWFDLQIRALSFKRKKCIILDLDNTIWGGILGEDGIFGIKSGGPYPGNAFQNFQQSLLELHKSGIILTVCSKNNETDVVEAWDKNPEILIRKEHLATFRINWENKVKNIAEIIGHLKIGPESVLYIDDNPGERELVKQFFPEITTPEFPEHPYLLPAFFKDIAEKHFSIYKPTPEDIGKTQRYQEENLRVEQQKEYTDLTSYLASLEITLEFRTATEMNIPRLAQLTQKTNQFNLTTKRYSESEIYSFINNKCFVYFVQVADRFGDSGITGLIIAIPDKEGKTAEIDTFLLSCRVLGKGIEIVFIAFVLNKLKKLGFQKVTGNYIESEKNNQVADFYDKTGFELTAKILKENLYIKEYSIDLPSTVFEYKPFYKINEI